MVKYNSHNVGGKVVEDTEAYRVTQNDSLKTLVLSSTTLYRGHKTAGRCSTGKEEGLFFVQGTGTMIIGKDRIQVGPGDIVLVPDGIFHYVINDGEMNLIFNCVLLKGA